MASLSAATSRTVSLIPTAAIVVVGSLAATVVTDVARENVYDVDMQGGDAVYPVAGAVLVMFLSGGRTARYLAIGMVSSSVTTAAREVGLI